jgi:hypothetical protein
MRSCRLADRCANCDAPFAVHIARADGEYACYAKSDVPIFRTSSDYVSLKAGDFIEDQDWLWDVTDFSTKRWVRVYSERLSLVGSPFQPNVLGLHDCKFLLCRSVVANHPRLNTPYPKDGFRIGQVFERKEGDRRRFMLVQPSYTHVALICLDVDPGNRWAESVSVVDPHHITAAEFSALCGRAEPVALTLVPIAINIMRTSG